MIRTRYLAGTAAALATTLAALPFLGAPAASAADGTVALAGSTVYTGSTVTLDVVDGDAAGAYEVFLMKGATKVATIATGTQIDGVTEIDWTIPTDIKTLASTGYSVSIDPATGTTFSTSGTFDIAASSIATAYLASSAVSTTALTTVEQLVPVYAKWTSNGATGGKVTLTLVKSGETKGTTLKKDTTNDGVEMVFIPTAKLAAGNYQLVVTPSYKTATAKTSTAFAVTAQTTLDIDPDSSTIKLGRTQYAYADVPFGSSLKIEILDAAGKSIAVLDKSYTYAEYGNGDDLPGYALTGAKLKAGTYKLLATLNEDKAVTKEVTFTVETWATPSLASGVAAILAAGVTQGQSIPLSVDTGNVEDGGSVTIQVTDGSKTYKVASKVALVAGKADVVWLVDKKMPAGSAYKVQVLNDADATVKAESSAFTVKVNQTALYKEPKVTATTTTVAATTTTVAATTTTVP